MTGFFGEIGELHRPAKYFPKGYSSLLPGIMLISNIRENGEPIGALPDGEMMFHHDMIHSEVPSKATLLYSVEIPSAGGNTLFASGYAAYETLDPAIRNKLEGAAPVTITIMARRSRATTRAPRPSANACIRSSAPMRTPAARRSTSTG